VYYELYIDVLFLVNFMMDYILLLITRKIIKSKISYGNICLGALVGSVLTCVVAAIPVPYTFIKFILFHAVINVVMIKIGLRIRWNRDFLRALITLYISGFLVGGVFSCLDQYVKTGSLFFALAIASYYISSGVLAFLMSLLHFGRYFCQVNLYVGEKTCTARALLDTGNRLSDAMTGKAVSIIDKEVAETLFEGKLPERIRYISYHSIGRKNGVIPIVTIDRMCICGDEDEWIEAPMIGISESTLSSGKEYDMILNPEA
jgi:stage II sporulation protein GA (sporulation sigma-E factor processing peptidase)